MIDLFSSCVLVPLVLPLSGSGGELMRRRIIFPGGGSGEGNGGERGSASRSLLCWASWGYSRSIRSGIKVHDVL